MCTSGVRYNRLFISFTASVVLSICSVTVEANSLKNFNAKRYAFFEESRVLPIFPPRGERPGEVYVDPNINAPFRFRWDACFGNLTAYEEPTRLLRFIEVEESELSGNA